LDKPSTRRILEAYTRDVGRGIIRIDYDTMDDLNISTGDVLLLLSKTKKSATKALPLYPSDEEKKIARLDKIERENLAINIGDVIYLEKRKSEPAIQIIVHPVNQIPELDSKYLADALESNAVIAGMKVIVPYFGGKLTFKVLNTLPDGIVTITQKTDFVIEEEDLPNEIREFEDYVRTKTQEMYGDVDKKIIKLLKEKKYDELKLLLTTHTNEVWDLGNMKKQIRKIMADKREYDKRSNNG